jgi:hypothetical protein
MALRVSKDLVDCFGIRSSSSQRVSYREVPVFNYGPYHLGGMEVYLQFLIWTLHVNGQLGAPVGLPPGT